MPAIPPSSALRRLFLESPSYADGLKRVARTPRHVSCNLMLTTADNMGICLEITPRIIFRISGSAGSDTPYILHSNHFKTQSFLCQSEIQDTLAGGSSWYRADRLEVGIRRKALIGFLTESDIMNAFKDHAGYPHSLCEHSARKATEGPFVQPGRPNPYSGSTCTVSCVIYNLTKRSIKVCKGPPCRGNFQEFALKRAFESRR
ncbi:hypothetical protein BDV35DRAFT_354143 [Aspergillus flavus]|uniref:Uncharacterized protein n=2 Tax=Aspergillus subgen. Circumdati TaxID=2720871 RepID=A0A5N6GVR4_ASPFL|nr:hypothetical protein BDV35DRAFT_354143 [Aspergillus flavus]